MVLANWAAPGNAKLIASERRFRNTIGIIKEIVGVERTVAQKLVHRAVELIRTRARNGVHDSAGSLPVLCRIVAGQNTKFLNGFHSKVLAKNASWSSIGVIINADAVKPVVILLRTRAGDAQLSAVSAVYVHCSMARG